MAMIHAEGLNYCQVADRLGLNNKTIRHYAKTHRDRLAHPEYKDLYDTLRKKDSPIKALIAQL